MQINRKEIRHVLTLATPVAVGGGSGTGDYNDLINKPKINNIELVGNVSLDDLGIQDYIEATTSVYRYKGNVRTVADLYLIENLENGDIYHVEANNCDYCWNATENRWDNFGNFLQVEALSFEDIDRIIEESD